MIAFAILLSIPFLLAKLSGTVVGTGYAAAVRHIVISQQLSKEQIESSEKYGFQSNVVEC